MRDAVLFDLDGVLVDSRAAISGALNHALVAHGLAPRPEAELYRYIGPPLVEAFAELTGLGVESGEVGAFVSAYREHYAVSSLSETLVVAGMPELLDALGERYRLAVATSKPLPYTEPLLAAVGLRARFEVVAGPALDVDMQPKATTVRAALDALGDPPAVMIGDRSHDVAGARANGLPVIGVTWGIGDAAELAGADALVAAPRELPEAIARLLDR
jgi:phosphoglycolate phosphatase